MGCSNVTIPNNSTEGYPLIIPLMLVISTLPMVINMHMALYIFWIKNTLRPKAILAISLAMADAISAAFYFINILVNSYLDTIDSICVPCPIAIIISICWQSSIIIGIYHLLAMSIHHFISIVQPMKYRIKITRKRTFSALAVLWTFPLLLTLIFFISTGDSGLWQRLSCKEHPPPHKISFRISYLAIFSIPLLIIMPLYACVVYTLQKQNVKWKLLSREGSKKNYHSSKVALGEINDYLKTVITTFWILGTSLIGWLPHLIINALICYERCLYHPDHVENYSRALYSFLGILPNVLILLKGIVNPFIYHSRIRELQDGRIGMHLAIKRKFYRVFTGTQFRRYPEIPLRVSVQDTVQEQLILCDSTTGSFENSEVIDTHL